MTSNLITSLNRQKELLGEILELAECQPELAKSGRVDDLKILLALRAAPLSELAAVEQSAEVAMRHTSAASMEELTAINELNLAILDLASRIADLDESTDCLGDICSEYESAD